MKPGFFIDRPVFSTVLSLVIVIVGIIGLVMLPYFLPDTRFPSPDEASCCHHSV